MATPHSYSGWALRSWCINEEFHELMSTKGGKPLENSVLLLLLQKQCPTPAPH